MIPFKILNGPDAGRTFTVGDRPVTVGRGQDQDIILADDKSSRGHLVFERRGDAVHVRDLGSSNGTFVNGELVTDYPHKEGDVVLVGHTEIRYGEPARPRVRVAAGQGRGVARDADGVRKEFAYGEPTHVLPAGQAGADEQRAATGAPRPASVPSDGPTRVLPPRGAPSQPAAAAEPDAAKTVITAAMTDSQIYDSPTRPLAETRSADMGTLAGMTAAVAGGLAAVASARRIRLATEMEEASSDAAVDGARAFAPLLDAAELALMAMREGVAVVLRAGVESGRCATLRLLVEGGPSPAEQATLRAVERRFQPARDAAAAHGGVFDVTPEDEPETAWRLRLPPLDQAGTVIA